MTPEQISELLANADIAPDLFVTKAVLIVRSKDMATGDTALHIGRSEDTDWITQVGMLVGATDMVRQVDWTE